MIDPVLAPGSAERNVTVAYALTSDGDDTYLRMTVLSARSARAAMQGCSVVVAMDGETARRAGEAVRAAMPPDTGFLVIETPAGAPVWRNRFVKSALRDRLSGPFIYLDGDTIVRDDLTAAYDWDFDVAAVSNHNAARCAVPGNERAVFLRCGWPVPTTAFCNAGVQFWRDTPAAHELARRYHEGWLHAAERTGRPQDQQAFNHALDQSAARVSLLPDAFNVQINSAPKQVFDAMLWHYFDSDRAVVAVPRTRFGDAVARREAVDVAAMMRATHPWVVTNPLDALAVRSFRKSVGQLGHGDWRRWWLAGDRRAFARYLAARVLGLPRRAARIFKSALTRA